MDLGSFVLSHVNSKTQDLILSDRNQFVRSSSTWRSCSREMNLVHRVTLFMLMVQDLVAAKKDIQLGGKQSATQRLHAGPGFEA